MRFPKIRAGDHPRGKYGTQTTPRRRPLHKKESGFTYVGKSANSVGNGELMDDLVLFM
jgi:hypothetical protein